MDNTDNFVLGIVSGMLIALLIFILTISTVKMHFESHQTVKKITYDKDYAKVHVGGSKIFFFDKNEKLDINVGDEIVLKPEKYSKKDTSDFLTDEEIDLLIKQYDEIIVILDKYTEHVRNTIFNTLDTEVTRDN